MQHGGYSANALREAYTTKRRLPTVMVLSRPSLIRAYSFVRFIELTLMAVSMVTVMGSSSELFCMCSLLSVRFTAFSGEH
jgi:hypothetical protein